MNLNEEYGLDAFFQNLVNSFPEVSLSLRRANNRVFASVSALDTLTVAISNEGELAGSTVRRAVTELHAKLVAADATPRISLVPVQPTNPAEVKYRRICAIEVNLEELNDELVGLSDRVTELFCSREASDKAALDAALARGVEIRTVIASLEAEQNHLIGEVEDLDPDRELMDELHDELETELGVCLYDLC